MDYLPLFYQLKGLRCLVVGGGEIATRKASMLQRAGALLRVVSPEFCAEMAKLLEEEVRSEKIQRNYVSADLEGVVLVIAATDDESTNKL